MSDKIDLWAIEHDCFEAGCQLVCGVDEAGRGPLCGSVVAAAVILPDGLYIEEISAGSGAAQAGLQVGDILLQVGDTRITDMDDLNTLLYNCNIGDKLDIIIYRSGVQYTATLVVEEYTG